MKKHTRNLTVRDWVKIGVTVLLITLICQATLWSLVTTREFMK